MDADTSFRKCGLRRPARGFPPRPKSESGFAPSARRYALRSLWLVVLVAVPACQPQPQVRKYRVPREEVAFVATDRMLVALVPHAEQVWSFKLTGSLEEVAPHAAHFGQLLQSLTFTEEGEPQWELPAGWEPLAGDGMRFATLRATQPTSAEISVIGLPAPQEALPNLNRWRQQMQLPPVTPAEVDAHVQRTEIAGGSAMIFDIQGRWAGGDRRGPPFARRPSRASREDGAAGLHFTSPPQWQPGAPGPMRRAAFEVTEGEQRVEITVITLPPAGSDVLSNVNRWRSQLSLEPLTEAQLSSEMQEMPIGGTAGYYVQFTDPAGARTILGAIVPRADLGWFFKLTGDAELAAREKDRFEDFLRSVRF